MIRIACTTGKLQAGHTGSEPSQTRFAQSIQYKLCPHGTKAPVTSLSPHTKHSLFAEPNNESVGDTLVAGEGLEVSVTPGNDQMLDVVVELSKLGDSPIPSSRSVFQIDTKSLILLPWCPELLELLEHEPELEKAPVLPVDEPIVDPNVSGVDSK